ncbi:serine/threonine-protein kinase [Actinoplanes sp. DH11]|uniref:serine/threonine-protein kinase n=1 Tax=Actinoplanes sp. DH11 TaxID=2857011 RepID=UPI001E538E71|nr:serine/threonine-protein kinase [Actinoplanes sp. DH11]
MESGFLIAGRYRLVEQLGHGGMSVVWRAEDDVLGRQVAVKVLSPRLAADIRLLSQLRAEARAAGGLRHPMVVEVYDYGETAYQGQILPYVVMELVEGRTMSELLSGNRIPWRLAVLVCAQVAAALAAAHARGVVHRDVKPGNVMVSSSGVKLVDFGISAAVGEMDGANGQLLGTPAYLAPERIRGGPVRPATDVYALGLLLYLSLAGRMPWQASTTTQMLKAHSYTEPAPLPSVPGLPSDVARLIPRCLDKKPGDRPTAAEIAEVLGEIAGLPPSTLLQTAAAPTVSIIRPRRWHHRVTGSAAAAAARLPGGRRTLVAGGAACALVAAGLTVWASSDPRTSSPAAAGSPAAACSIRYTIGTATADGRTSTAVTILNSGQVAVPAWQLTFALPGDQKLVRGWSADWRQQGEMVRADGAALAAGGAVATGFETTSHRQPAAVPGSFTLNGTTCHTQASAPAPSATPTTAPPNIPRNSARTTAGKPGTAAPATARTQQPPKAAPPASKPTSKAKSKSTSKSKSKSTSKSKSKSTGKSKSNGKSRGKGK